MSEHGEFLGESGAIQWEREVRGYNRQQVDEYVAWRNQQIRELESKLSQGLAEIERLRRDVAEAREAGARPAHEEISERVGQILKLAAEEAKAERERGATEIAQMRDLAKQDTDKLRADTKRETDQVRAHAQDQAERMLAAAAEQSERSVTAAKNEAEQLVSAAQSAAEQTVAAATKHAESTVAAAMAQAKQQLDEATARATAIHEGAERRLNLLISRHTETVRRLTEIRDVVTSLVAGEAARGSLEDEVARAMSAQAGNSADGRQGTPHDALQGGGHRPAQRPAGTGEARRHAPGPAGPGDGAPAQQPGQGGRQGSPQPVGRPGPGQPGVRHRDQADALSARDGEPGRHQAETSAHQPDDLRHVDDLGHPVENVRHPGSMAGMSSRGSDRVLDETAPSGRAIDG